jgi:hypothetical protein
VEGTKLIVGTTLGTPLGLLDGTELGAFEGEIEGNELGAADNVGSPDGAIELEGCELIDGIELG